MIKKSLLSMILLLSFGFSSCDSDDIEALLPAIDIDVLEKGEIPIDVDKTDGDWVDFSGTMEISIDNSDTNKYLNKIKKVKINRLRYKVLRFEGDPNGEVQGAFTADNGATLRNAFKVQSAHMNGTVFEVTETDELNRIAAALKARHRIQINYSGKALCDQDEMDFVVEVELQGVVTVDP